VECEGPCGIGSGFDRGRGTFLLERYHRAGNGLVSRINDSAVNTAVSGLCNYGADEKGYGNRKDGYCAVPGSTPPMLQGIHAVGTLREFYSLSSRGIAIDTGIVG
jgi:hypothetical protein